MKQAMKTNVSELPGTAADQPDSDLISVVVAVEGAPNLRATLEMYRPVLDEIGAPYEVICAFDGRQDVVLSELNALAETWPELLVLGQSPWADEEAAMQTAIRRSSGDRILTIAGWPEVAPEAISKLISELDNSDFAVAVRKDFASSGRNKLLQRTLSMLFGRKWSDLFCRTRAVRRPTMEESIAFGVRQHFLPTISAEIGRNVVEVEVASAPADAEGAAKFVFKPLSHVWALFDAIMLYVVLKFLRRPLRFFGAVGLPIFLLGTVITATYLGMRLFGDMPLGDRPGLIFGVLMLVLGLQIIALGLIGEIIIFARSRQMKQYTVKSVIRGGSE